MLEHNNWIPLALLGAALIISLWYALRRRAKRRQETEEERETRQLAEKEGARHRRAEGSAALLSILSSVAGLAAVVGIGSWLTMTPANPVQQILAGIWLTCGLLGLVAVTVGTGAHVVADAIRESAPDRERRARTREDAKNAR